MRLCITNVELQYTAKGLSSNKSYFSSSNLVYRQPQESTEESDLSF